MLHDGTAQPQRGLAAQQSLQTKLTLVAQIIATNRSPDDIYDTIMDRLEPHVTLDLKGFGLQFPREYVITLCEEISNLYDDPLIKEEVLILKDLFENISVEGEDGLLTFPKRGVGLGYYTNVLVLAMDIILDDIRVIAAFADDMLIRLDDYERCLARLESQDLIINEKKSGEEWINVAWFMNVGISPVHIAEFHAELGAVFNYRYHWQRKMHMSSITHLGDTRVVCYHLMRIFGHEFTRDEWSKHQDDGGYIGFIPPEEGYSKVRLAAVIKPWKDKNDILYHHIKRTGTIPAEHAKKTHLRRKGQWVSQQSIWTYDYELVRPTEVYDAPTIGNARRLTENWMEEILLDCYNLSDDPIKEELQNSDYQRVIEDYGSFRDPLRAAAYGATRGGRALPTIPDDSQKEKIRKKLYSESLQPLFAFHRRLREEQPFNKRETPTMDFAQKYGILPLDAYRVVDCNAQTLEEAGLDLPDVELHEADSIVSEVESLFDADALLSEASDDDDMEDDMASVSSWT